VAVAVVEERPLTAATVPAPEQVRVALPEVETAELVLQPKAHPVVPETFLVVAVVALLATRLTLDFCSRSSAL
jgi:hypothetical protein